MINKYSILNGGKYPSLDGLQHYLALQLFIDHFSNENDKIDLWKSKGMSRESITLPSTTDKSYYPEVINLFSVSLVHKNVVNLYITYKLDIWPKNLNIDFTTGNCLFGAVKLTKNADPDKYKYTGYGIGFHSRSRFSWTDASEGKMLLLELMIVLLCKLMEETKIF